ncbi:MAG: 2-C-methyl-D-erythritol 4-phosphate cytidylyltransferase [Flavobacteriales bacterium]|nr:2-C-methyl-D-erythritol 4-phosphate cytidylyltransferase [Flavobacteriales bacterium]
MERSAIIVAGGSGRRMGAAIPKQFLLLQGEPLLFHTLRAFHAFDPHMPLVLVLPADHHTTWEDLCAQHEFEVPHTLVAGGAERFHSTLEGLNSVLHDGLVAVHDGVRPLVSPALIARCFNAAMVRGAAIPVVPIPSSVRRVEGSTSHAVDRSALRAVQTPQCFKVDLLREAFELPYDPAFTDEATLVERLGVNIQLVDGEDHNIKVTTPFDLEVAELVLGGRG